MASTNRLKINGNIAKLKKRQIFEYNSWPYEKSSSYSTWDATEMI